MAPEAIELIVPNFKRRLSGVTSTIVQLVPLQSAQLHLATLGPGLPRRFPRLPYRRLPSLLSRPRGRPFRIWHARRNTEMLAGLLLRDVFRAPLRLVFTSASQRVHTRWTRFLIGRMDSVIATSERTGAYLTVPHTVIMHGIDTRRFAPASEPAAAKTALGLDPARQYVGCFGRVRHQKGTDLFVDAMIRALPSRPGWAAIVAGRATGPHIPFEADLKARVAAAGLADRILFVGEHTNIPDWYRALSLFVAPQRWEGFGLTPLEAMATAVPVVATDVGAFPELVVDGETGTVIPRDNAEAMVAAVERFMDDEAGRKRASAAALSHVRQKFPLEREVADLSRVYQRLWDSGAGR